MPSCIHDIASEAYADFILSNYLGDIPLEAKNKIVCTDYADSLFSIIYTQPVGSDMDNFAMLPYAVIPNLYTLLDTTSMTASGIEQVLTQPFLNLRGQGTMIGFIDTGIDYQNPLFQNTDGTTRIQGIWDQTLSTFPDQNEAPDSYPTVSYGSHFSREQINEALQSDRPLDVVPSIDEDGHGTFMTGIAAGNQSFELNFTGAAPECSIGVVKLKPAKRYLRDFYSIQSSADAYQENDIMMGIRYLMLLAGRYQMPLVIYIGVGTNYGSHEGTTPLAIILRRINQLTGITTILPAGDEGGLRHHFQGSFRSGQEYQDVEIKVGGRETGFVTQLWASAPEAYSVGFISPAGQVIQRVPINYQTGTVLSFILEATEIIVYYGISEFGSGSKFVFMRFRNPTEGVWRIRVYNRLFINGQYNLWLPVAGFISEDTFFLSSNPNTIITEPGNTPDVITVGAFNHHFNSIYLGSSRGYNRVGVVKPDIVAPGVDVYGPGTAPGFPLIQRSGTSIAAAHVAGAAANLMTWGIVQGNRSNMSTSAIKAILVRGADRPQAFSFPNREWGFGKLDLFQSFVRMVD